MKKMFLCLIFFACGSELDQSDKIPDLPKIDTKFELPSFYWECEHQDGTFSSEDKALTKAFTIKDEEKYKTCTIIFKDREENQ